MGFSLMGRCEVKEYRKCFFNAETFFLADMQQELVRQALDLVDVPYGTNSKAIRRALALTYICNEFMAKRKVLYLPNKVECEATVKL